MHRILLTASSLAISLLVSQTYAASQMNNAGVSTTGYVQASSVSLTTVSTTWGYLTGTSSYLPNLNTTNISLTTINGLPLSSFGSASPTDVPTFRAHRNNVNQTIAASTWTKIEFTTKDFDSYNNFSTDTSRFTPTVAGYYLVSGGTYCLSSTTCWVMIRKNLVNAAQSGMTEAGTIVANASTVLYFNGTTDYVELWAYTYGTTLAGESGQTNFSASLLASGNGLTQDTTPSGAIMAFDLTTCPAGWSEYTAARGRFLRGIDNGEGNDPSGTRIPGNTQDDALKSHTHGPQGGTGRTGFMTNTYPDTTTGIGGSGAGTIGVGYLMLTTGATGTSETRPKNVAVLFCRKN